jgi:hypothetical protein
MKSQFQFVKLMAIEIIIGKKLKTIIPRKLGSINGMAFFKALFCLFLLIFFPVIFRITVAWLARHTTVS